MKKYSVLCIEEPFTIVSVEVEAMNAEEAKEFAPIVAKRMGYKNVKVAPEIPGAPVVMEI